MANEVKILTNISLFATPTANSHVITVGAVNTLLAGKSNTDHTHTYLKPTGGGTGTYRAPTNASADTYLVSQARLFPAFNSANSYVVGDFVTSGGSVYRCTTAHTGAWNGSHFSESSVKEYVDAQITAAISDRGKYYGTITGDGTTTSFNVTHNLASTVLLTEVYDEEGSTVLPTIKRYDANTLQIKFGQAPANGYVYNVAITSLAGTTSDVDTIVTGFSAHVNAISAHGSTATPTANKIAMYGTNGNLVSGTPLTATEVATKGYVDSFPLSIHAGLVNLQSSTVTLQDNVTIYKYSVSATTTFTFSTSSLVRTDGALTFELYIVMPSTVYTITFPNNVSWLNGEAPSMSTPSKTYMIVFRSLDGGSTWLGSKEGAY